MNLNQTLQKTVSEEHQKIQKKRFEPLLQDDKEELSEIEKDRKELKFPRSRRYVKALIKTKDLTESEPDIKEQVENAPIHNKLLGILGECGIPGCIIHSLDKYGDIVEHYRSVDDIPDELKEGYAEWGKFPGRIGVEVYTHTYCIIYDDGSVKFVDRDKQGQ